MQQTAGTQREGRPASTLGRRTVLLAGATGVGSTAGCLGSDDGGEDPAPTDPTATTQARPAPAGPEAVTSVDQFVTLVESDDPSIAVIDAELDVSEVAPIDVGRFTTVVSNGGYKQYPITNTSSNDTFRLGNPEEADVYVHFEGVTFTGDNSCPYHFGIAEDKAMEVSFNRCWFEGADIAGYLHKGQWRTHFFNCQFSGNWGKQDHAIVAEQHPDTGNNQLKIANGNQVDGHASHGIYIKGMGGFSMFGSTCEHNGGYGVYIEDGEASPGGSNGVDIVGSFFESNKGGIYVGNNNGVARIAGGKFFHNDGKPFSEGGKGVRPHIVLADGASALVQGCTLQHQQGNPAIRTAPGAVDPTFVHVRTDGDPVDLNHSGGTIVDCTFGQGIAERVARLESQQ
jgi:hypothetical protein